MGNKAASSESNGEINEESKNSESLVSDQSRVAPLAFKSLPVALLSEVGDYFSDDKDDPVKYALLGEQPITIALSQNYGNAWIAPCWHVGCLPSERQWQGLAYFKNVRNFLIKDHESCLRFLAHKSSSYCRVFVEVLVVSLYRTEWDPPIAFNDLRRTLTTIQEHLSSAKHVVISISEYDSFCFSFKDTIDNVTGLPVPRDLQKTLFQIIDDLNTCWNKSHTFNANELFAFYFESEVKPISDMYLVKCTILLNHEHGQALFKKKAPHNLSKKIMWVYDAEYYHNLCLVTRNAAYYYGVKHIDYHATRLCNAIHFEEFFLDDETKAKLGDRWKHAFCYQDNPFVERIVIRSSEHCGAMQLLRPIEPLTDASTFSALIEITLEGEKNTLHLTQLNNGFFPHLKHLSIIDARITGHLDSRCVPSLKTLIIGPKIKDEHFQPTLNPLVRERVRLLIHSGHPWQLVATQSPGGWSLASYQESNPDPQEDTKEESYDSPHWLPLIKELLLVPLCKAHIDEWQLQLSGGPSPEAAADDHKDRILMWSPECVQKITAIRTVQTEMTLNFNQVIPGETRILSSLECHRVGLVLNGAALPDLQSLQVNDASVKPWGAFSKLQTLSFYCVDLSTQWKLDAPLLKSFNFHGLRSARNLSLNPKLLQHLSFLYIATQRYDIADCPEILIDEDDVLGLSRVEHVVLHGEMRSSPIFEQYRLSDVLHLDLDVDVARLPTCWDKATWQCETLKIYVYVSSYEFYKPPQKLEVVLPLLPRVKKLTVTAHNYRVLLNREMRELTHCTVDSPVMFGENLKCPALRRIRFTGDLSENDKKQCLNPATYRAMGARPEMVYFCRSDEAHSVAWDLAPSESTPLFSKRVFFFAFLFLFLSLFFCHLT